MLAATIVFMSAQPTLYLLTATAMVGYVTIKLIPLIAGQETLKLPFTKFLMSFIPLLAANIIAIVLLAGFARILYRETLFLMALISAVTVRFALKRYKLEIAWTIEYSLLWLMLPSCAVLIVGMSIFLPFTPAQWDVMTYHLYIPVRWLQAGRIIHVPTFYGDEAAAFAPGNTVVLYAWVLSLLNNDVLITVFQVIFLLFSGLVTVMIVKRFNEDNRISLLLATIVIVAPVMFFKAFSGYTDLLAQSLLAAGIWWLLEYLECSSREHGRIVIYPALCLGLSVGAKTVMLPMALPVILFLLVICIYRRNWKDLLLALTAVLASGGWWYCSTWWHYGNPLFPAQFKLFNTVIFSGLYDYAALMTRAEHLHSWYNIAAGFYAEYGMPAALLLPLGWIGWLVGIFHEHMRRQQVIIIFGVTVFWAAIFCLVVPYNDQFRFLLGTWTLAFSGIVILLNLIRTHILKMSILISIILWMLFQDVCSLLTLLDGVPTYLPLTLGVGISGAAVALLFYIRRHSITGLCCSVMLMLFVLILSECQSDGLRIMTMTKTNIGAFRTAFAKFNLPESPTVTIAYSGVNIPYIFVGPHLKNQVVFCNLSGNYSDNSYDFWNRNACKVFSFKGPKTYQLNPSRTAWTKNLISSGAQILVIMQIHPFEYNFHYHDENGFPLELAWAEKLPKIFTPLVRDDLSRVYLINRDELEKASAKTPQNK